NEACRGALLAAGGRADDQGPDLEGVAASTDEEMEAVPQEVPRHRKEMDQERVGIGFRDGLDRTEELPRQADPRLLADGTRPGVIPRRLGPNGLESRLLRRDFLGTSVLVGAFFISDG